MPSRRRRARQGWTGRWGTAAAIWFLTATLLALGPAAKAFASTTSTSTSTSTSSSTTQPTTTTTYGGSPTTLNFTGALHGTLHIVPMNNCGTAGKFGATLDTINGKLGGGGSAHVWHITIYTPNKGKYKYVKNPKSHLEKFSFVLETPGKSQAKSWADTGGTLTNNSGKGSVNLVLTGRTGGAHGTVHVKGSWNCPATG